MDKRRIHIDFHTSEKIEGIGAHFSEEEFIAMLHRAQADSVTLFAKCHHGNFYYKDTAFRPHPHLATDLLPRQLVACKKAGVRALVYVSAGVDQQTAYEHPEWLYAEREPLPEGESPFRGYYNPLCFRSGYLSLLAAQVKEVVEKFRPYGIFLDIVEEKPCYCPACRAAREARGQDPYSETAAKAMARETLHLYYKTINETARAVCPDILIFHNSGNFPRGRRDMIGANTHLEVESLPTGRWGYDHFPMSVCYLRRRDKFLLGMTGKFRGEWGDFGSFKYPDALLYECAQAAAFGAGTCVGDQMHPSGRMDAYTYENIGNAFSYVRSLESKAEGEFVADLAILSQDVSENAFSQPGDTGASRMLLEGKYLFDVIDGEEISSRYRLIILPELKTIPPDVSAALEKYVAAGGKLLASGASLAALGGRIDLGAEDLGEDPEYPAYFRFGYPVRYIGGESAVIYHPCRNVACTGEQLAEKLPPYFRRHGLYFCSHQHTPCDYDKPRTPAVTRGRHGIFIAADIFADYAASGSMNDKEAVLPLIDMLIGRKTVECGLPSQGKVTFRIAKNYARLDLLFANTIRRGEGIEVIEDIVPLYNVPCSVAAGRKVSRVYLFPQNTALPFAEEEGRVCFTVPYMRAHQAVILE